MREMPRRRRQLGIDVLRALHDLDWVDVHCRDGHCFGGQARIVGIGAKNIVELLSSGSHDTNLSAALAARHRIVV